MENYDIFRLNNFLIYKKTGTDGFLKLTTYTSTTEIVTSNLST